jgi:hypothetical protein
MLARAPYRTDLLAPYFRWQISQGNQNEVWDWCEEILAKNPNDPIALWFKGSLLHHSAANKFRNQALDAGVSRIIPIDPELEQQIRKAKQY